MLSLFYILCFTENRLTENRVWPRMCTTICEKFLLHINFFLQKWFSYSLIELIRNTPIQMFWTKPWVILALRSYLVQIETSQFYVPLQNLHLYKILTTSKQRGCFAMLRLQTGDICIIQKTVQYDNILKAKLKLTTDNYIFTK